LGPGRYVCARHLRASAQPPGGLAQPELEEGALLPHAYAFVAYYGTRAYAHPSDLRRGAPVEAFGEGFAMIVLAERLVDGVALVQTRRGLWVEAESLRRAQPSAFEGRSLGPGEGLDFAWVRAEGVPIRERIGGRLIRRSTRRELLHLEGQRGRFATLRGGGVIARSSLAGPTQSDPPSQVGPAERWIDVDLEAQVLTLYAGRRPLFATLVSTGRPAHSTPRGEFRIWAKLATSDMDDLGRDDVERNYAIEAVPWVQYFERGYGLHAAFWHDDFGRTRSHGCVNLSPRDARYLFSRTRPGLPDGWEAILSIEEDRPTLVRVR
ncbi:MAG: L,D-transpeptidase, partial [Myxococcales bacterium]|nr:L,D-transpeptidase [Myxococcales bacterium]